MKHLSYTQFKNIFGEWGVTTWLKFNWLANGLPDGTYNGLTKVTIKSVTNINNNKRAYISGLTPIKVNDNNAIWNYGLCSLKVISSNASYQGVRYNNACVDTNGFLFIQIPNIKQTVEAYNEYLSKNPVVFCFYDNRQWNGVIVSQLDSFQAATGFGYVGIGVSSKEVHETSGTFTSLLPQNQPTFLFNAKDKTMASSTSTSANRLMFMSRLSTSAEDFKNKFLPLSVVYKK